MKLGIRASGVSLKSLSNFTESDIQKIRLNMFLVSVWCLLQESTNETKEN